MRKPLQGVYNILRFNWHFYAIAFICMLLLLVSARFLQEPLQFFAYASCIVVTGTPVVSLLASCYIYDLSGIYNLSWVAPQGTDRLVVNINAGFDETSALLKSRFKNAEVVTMDFYEPAKHTEVSIKRARKAYPPFPGTKQTKTSALQLPGNSVDKIFLIFSAHEIRDVQERTTFFHELNRILKPTGQVFVTEHLRDIPNFLAYTFGFFHFYSRSSWLGVFNKTEFQLAQEIKITPFISTFILQKNGNTL